MTQEEQSQFRKDFLAISHQKELINQTNDYLRRLHVYDKNDSHKRHILNAVKRKEEQQIELRRLLKGRNFESWKDFKTKLNGLNLKLNKILDRKQKIEEDINSLIF